MSRRRLRISLKKEKQDSWKLNLKKKHHVEGNLKRRMTEKRNRRKNLLKVSSLLSQVEKLKQGELRRLEELIEQDERRKSKEALIRKELGINGMPRKMKSSRKRFRLEYLGALIPHVKPDDVIFAECFNPERVYWRLGKTIEVPPEKGECSEHVAIKNTNFKFGRYRGILPTVNVTTME
ncbi:hypothetical protein NPIL_454001 [Nephila pilipes]|uniref:Uncharacterized protein n=1 Tax=Nephila pilipes TaxID=299642 RepID=A0A8X6NDZ2_NEPPI|nr:hypothetical protein NPIL_454001 [Nephila pilipes]